MTTNEDRREKQTGDPARGARSMDAVDLMKFIASILIFSMHFKALNDVPALQFALEMLARWGVPFFFVSSAYFLFRRGGAEGPGRAGAVRYLKRIAMLYLVWFVINLPNVVYLKLYSAGITNVRTWINLFKDLLLSSTFTGSWFLASCMFGAWFVWLLGRKLKTAYVLMITFPLYLCCVLDSAYSGVNIPILKSVMDFLKFPLNIFNGCFFFAVGKYIAENEEKLKRKLRPALCAVFAVLSYFAFFAEIRLAKGLSVFGSTDAAFSLIPAAFFLFILSVSVNVRIKKAPLLRKLSTVIYCCQGDLLCVKGFLEMRGFTEPYFVLYVISLAMLAAVCALVLLIQNKTEWKWRMYLT